MYTTNFTANVTRWMMIGNLKAAGSSDPDILRGIVDSMLGEQKPAKTSRWRASSSASCCA